MSEANVSEAAGYGGYPPEVRRRRGWIGVALWITVLIACGVYAYTTHPLEGIRSAEDQLFHPDPHPRTLLGMMIEYWMLLSLILVLVLIIAGQLGRSLGIPALFRDAPPPGPEWGSRWDERSRGFGAAFWGGLGATLVVAQVWTAIYYSELTLQLNRFDPSHFVAGTRFRSHLDLLIFIGLGSPPFLAMIVLAAALPKPAPGMERRGWAFAGELARFVAGMAIGAVLVAVAALLGAVAHNLLPSFEMRQLFENVRHYLKIQQAFPEIRGVSRADLELSKAAVTASFAFFVVVVFGFYTVLVGFFRRSLSPGMGICVLFSFWILVYSIMILLNSTGQMFFGLGLAGWAVLCNVDPYKYRFPGMGRYYERSRRVDAQTFDPDAPPRPGQRPITLIPTDQVLTQWKEQTGQDRPRLVLVAVTGGAYRAAFWTTVVLDELSRVLNGFPRHVRLITGASGGMVGAAYYAALMRPGGAPPSVTGPLREESGRDSLTPIARRLVRRDLPRALWPVRQAYDRGIVLEEQWRTLDLTFGDPGYLDGERAGWRPSLVLSPMVVETGRRLLFSNLDLHDLVALQARALPSSPGGGPKIYGRSAVQFFRVFPDAYPTFRLGTAVRMSATFPYASPAVNLPTIPPRRVVDAGYYDNYGVDLAAAWAYANQDWIRANTSGLALIEIRAYPTELDRLAQLALRDELSRDPAAQLFARLRTSVQGLTSPLEGGLNARAWSMQFHNAAAVRVLDDLFNVPGQPRLFETFVFENFEEFAMNWFISDDDLDRMQRSIGARPGLPALAPGAWTAHQTANLNEKDRLIAWW
jgi:hypothetical protein